VEGRVFQSEAVHESLKNVILVMHTAGILAPLADEHRNEGHLWHVTCDKVEPFMPGFMETLVPLSSAVLPSSAKASTAASPTAEKLNPPPADIIVSRTVTESTVGASIV
jgi:hypothetical protein